MVSFCNVLEKKGETVREKNDEVVVVGSENMCRIKREFY